MEDGGGGKTRKSEKPNRQILLLTTGEKKGQLWTRIEGLSGHWEVICP